MKTLTPTALAKTNQRLGSGFLIIIEIDWVVAGTKYYTKKPATFNTVACETKLFEHGNIVNRGSQFLANSALSTMSVSLDDTSGELKTLVNQETIEGTKCRAYIRYTDTADVDAIEILRGKISGNVSWSEGERVLDFDIESFSDDSEFGYKDSEDKIWPLVFGTVNRLPAMKAQESYYSGKLLVSISISSSSFTFTSDDLDLIPDGALDYIINEVTYSGIKTGTTVAVTGVNINEDSMNAQWTADVGTEIKFLTGEPAIFVANLVESTSVLEVCARMDGYLILIPEDYYTINLAHDFQGQVCTTISFDPALENISNESWAAQVWVTCVSTVGPNTSDIIKWLFETYSTYDVDTASFASVAVSLANYPSNFALTTRSAVYKMCEDIAWQARCTIFNTNGVIHIKYLSIEDNSVLTMIQDIVKLKTLELGFTSIEDVRTKLVASWICDHSAVDKNLEYIYTNNIDLFGTNEMKKAMFIYNSASLVELSVHFWGYRLSNVWRLLSTVNVLPVLKLDPYDCSLVQIPVISTNDIKGLVEESHHDLEDKTIQLEMVLNSKSGDIDGSNQPLPDEGFWTGNYVTNDEPYPEICQPAPFLFDYDTLIRNKQLDPGVKVYNAGTSSISHYSALEVVAPSNAIESYIAKQGILLVQKPTQNDLEPKNVVFTQVNRIGIGNYGIAYKSFPIFVPRLEDGTFSWGNPPRSFVINENVGTVTGSFWLSRFRLGFKIKYRSGSGAYVEPDDIPGVRIYNDSQYYIPGGSALEITTVVDEQDLYDENILNPDAHIQTDIVKVTRPTQDNLPPDKVLFTMGVNVDPWSYGWAFSASDLPRRITVKGGNSLEIDQEVGTSKDSFEMDDEGGGFKCTIIKDQQYYVVPHANPHAVQVNLAATFSKYDFGEIIDRDENGVPTLDIPSKDNLPAGSLMQIDTAGASGSVGLAVNSFDVDTETVVSGDPPEVGKQVGTVEGSAQLSSEKNGMLVLANAGEGSGRTRLRPFLRRPIMFALNHSDGTIWAFTGSVWFEYLPSPGFDWLGIFMDSVGDLYLFKVSGIRDSDGLYKYNGSEWVRIADKYELPFPDRFLPGVDSVFKTVDTVWFTALGNTSQQHLVEFNLTTLLWRVVETKNNLIKGGITYSRRWAPALKNGVRWHIHIYNSLGETHQIPYVYSYTESGGTIFGDDIPSTDYADATTHSIILNPDTDELWLRYAVPTTDTKLYKIDEVNYGVSVVDPGPGFAWGVYADWLDGALHVSNDEDNSMWRLDEGVWSKVADSPGFSWQYDCTKINPFADA